MKTARRAPAHEEAAMDDLEEGPEVWRVRIGKR